MTHASISLMERFERILDGVVAKAVDTRNQLERQAGTRPIGWEEGDDLDQLERYLDVRDNPAAWAALFEEQRLLYGRDAGEMQMAAFIIEMEAKLAKHGGAQAVRAALLMRRIRKARPVLKQIERIDDLPEYDVLPALPAYDEMSALASLAAGELPEFQPVIQTPADVAPPMPNGAVMPYGNG